MPDHFEQLGQIGYGNDCHEAIEPDAFHPLQDCLRSDLQRTVPGQISAQKKP